MEQVCALLRRPRTDGLRVAVVTETYPPEVNGVAMTIERMVNGLRVRGHQVQIVRPRQRHEPATQVQGHVPEQYLVKGLPIPRYPGLRFGLARSARLVRLWRLWRPQLVHVVTEGPLGWAAVRAGRLLGLPVVSDFHTNFHAYARHYGVGCLRWPVTAWLRKLHNATDLTLVPTAALAGELRAYGYQRVRVVSRGVDTALFNPARRSEALRRSWGADGDPLVVMHVGRLAPEKNLPLVVRAFDAIAQVRKEAKLVFVGDGPARAQLEAMAPQAVFAGMRRGEDLARHYASADVFIFPSLTETFGNVTLEALASGVPVVAYAHAGAAELVAPGRSGMLAAPGDEAAFTAAAAQLVGDPVALAEMRALARASAEARDWDHVHDEFEACLRECAAKPEENDDGRQRIALAPH